MEGCKGDREMTSTTASTTSPNGDDLLEMLGAQASRATRVALPRESVEAAAAARRTLETYYAELAQYFAERAARRAQMGAEMAARGVAACARGPFWAKLRALETQYLRARRQRMRGRAFEALAVIGRGAYGEVRLVRLRDTGHVFAMKILDKEQMVARRQQLHALSERLALTASGAAYRDRNPWVVRLHCSFQDAARLYLVMEYVPGGDLMRVLMEHKTLSEAAARFYVAETVMAVESIHRLHYVHRDVKPDNILLDAHGHIKLSDFGLCARIGVSGDVIDDGDASDGGGSSRNPAAGAKTGTGGTTTASSCASSNRRAMLLSTVGTPDYTFVLFFFLTHCKFTSRHHDTSTWKSHNHHMETINITNQTTPKPQNPKTEHLKCCNREDTGKSATGGRWE